MKKRIISAILASAMLLSITGCSKKEEKIAYHEGMTLEEYIEKVELPKNLTISIDPATVTDQTTVYTYDKVEYMDFDIDWLAEQLLQNPVTSENVYEEGTEWTAETDTQTEYLAVHDGGEALNGNAETSSDGGFYYRFLPDYPRYHSWTLVSDEYPELYMRDGRETYFFSDLYNSVNKELDFASREEIADKAISFFQDAGVPAVEVREIIAYDMDVLSCEYDRGKKTHEEMYADILSHDPELAAGMSAEYDYLEPQKSDENYWVLCRQLIDGIPVDTYDVQYKEVENIWPYHRLDLQYTEEGMVDNYVISVIQQPEQKSGKEESIIDSASVLELVREYYGQGILLESHNVESLELVYRVRWSEGEKSASLVPFWMVRISYPTTVNNQYIGYGGEEQITEKEVMGYDHLYFNAITGEYLEESTSGKPSK